MSACSAARWSFASSVSRTRSPGCGCSLTSIGLVGRPSESTRSCSSPGCPRSTQSNADSMPALADRVAERVAAGAASAAPRRSRRRSRAAARRGRRTGTAGRTCPRSACPGTRSGARRGSSTWFSSTNSFTVTGVERVALVLLDLRRDVRERNVEDAGEALQLCVGALLRQVGRPDLDRGACPCCRRGRAVPVVDRPARRRMAEEAELVVLAPPARNWFPESTWSAQSRKKSTPNAVSDEGAEDADPEDGLRREPVRASARGSGGRKRPGRCVPATASQRTRPPGARAGGRKRRRTRAKTGKASRRLSRTARGARGRARRSRRPARGAGSEG